MFVYVIVNSETLKIYVGQHKGNNLRKYLQTKLSDAAKNRGGRSRLFNSMRKHDPSVWSIHPLISDIQTRAELDEHEKLLIKALNSKNPEVGYNICRGGEGFTGTHTEESRQKMKDHATRPWLGKKRPPETATKAVATRRQKNGGRAIPLGWNQDVESIAKRVATRKALGNYGVHRIGTKHTLETLGKMRAAKQEAKAKETMRQHRLAYLETLPTGNRSSVKPPNTAWCCGHKQFLPVETFSQSSKRASGVRPTCKACRHDEYTRRKARNGLPSSFPAGA